MTEPPNVASRAVERGPGSVLDRPLRLRHGLLLLWLAAVLLLVWHLGGVPLRDWDESLVARVAEEISRVSFPGQLLPTFWGEAYLNKPPLLHGLIAGSLLIGRWLDPALASVMAAPAWQVRLVPALCSSLIVPLLGLVQWRLRPGDRLAALSTAAVALTLLPLMRHGRLAMLDGTLVVAMVLQWWALLSLDREAQPEEQHRWALVVGLAGSIVLLLKAPAVLPLQAGGCLLLALERRWSLRQWPRLLGWMAVGLAPGLLWHLWHLSQRGSLALQMWTGQGMARVVQAMEGHSEGVSVPLLEVLEGGGPWLALWPIAMVWAWQQRRQRWGRWVLGLTLLTALMVLPLRTQLPWYSHLLWPSFCLAVGPLLAWLVSRQPSAGLPLQGLLVRVPWFWMLLGGVAVVLSPQLPIPMATALLAGVGLCSGGCLGLPLAGVWRPRAAALMVLSLWAALLALFNSSVWLWELNEMWPVTPAAAAIRALPPTLRGLPLYRIGAHRPSLEWAIGHQIPALPQDQQALRRRTPSLLVLADPPLQLPDWQCMPVQAPVLSDPPSPRLYHCQP